MLSNRLVKYIERGLSIILIGKTNSGKSYFVKKELISLLKKKFRVVYFKDGDNVEIKKADVAIFDEAELLFDKTRLEKQGEIFSRLYLNKVNKWQILYKKFNMPSIYIVTRNEMKDINYIKKNYKKAEWDNRKITVIKYI